MQKNNLTLEVYNHDFLHALMALLLSYRLGMSALASSAADVSALCSRNFLVAGPKDNCARNSGRKCLNTGSEGLLLLWWPLCGIQPSDGPW